MIERIPYIRIFISSPGDVNDERQIALEVIEQLPYRPALREKVAFRVVGWDKPRAGTPMRATLTPQEAINRGLPTPAECDIVIVLFWSEIGTPFTHTDGTEYQSSTQWELLNALEAKRPETLIYRRTDEPPYKVSDPDFDEKYVQYKALEAFFKSELFYGPDGKIRRGINIYKTPEDFRLAFETALEVLVLEILSRPERTGSPEVDLKDTENISTLRAIKWPIGKSPFPGLRAYAEVDSPIFFGRSLETSELVKRVEANRFTAVIAASGSGKSSLVAAGLIPRLKSNAIVSETTGSKDWRFARLTPGQGNSPFSALFTALCDAFPEHPVSPFLIDQEESAFVNNITQNAAGIVTVCNALLREAKAPGWAEVLFFIDQFEELFTLIPEERAQERIKFVSILEEICASSRIRCIVTMRSDFYANCLEIPALAALMKNATYPLSAPNAGALIEMIKRPAERANLIWDEGLPEQIQADIGSDAGALALMAYALEELYHAAGAEKRLTFASYNSIDRDGAIGKRAEDTFDQLILENKVKVFEGVFCELVVLDERATATRQRAPLTIFKPDELTLIRAFTDARLLVTHDLTVEVAHEALFRSWKRLQSWINSSCEDLILLQQMRAAAHDWQIKGRRDYLLWSQERLQLVEAMINRLDPKRSQIEMDFIEPEQNRLLREIDEINTNHRRRRWIGERLANIGDPRSGIGLNEHGIPQVSWEPVPNGGIVEFQEQSFATRPFYISKYMITHLQFQAFIDATDGMQNHKWWSDFPTLKVTESINVSAPDYITMDSPIEDIRSVNWGFPTQAVSVAVQPYDNYPRDSVSWYQAVAFTRWLNEKYHRSGLLRQILGEDWEIRLPLEQEWQWMAQVGTQKSQYPWGEWDEFPRANTAEAGIENVSTAVGLYPHGRADCGAYDVAGNLLEWCLNDFENPQIINGYRNMAPKSLRGGSFGDPAQMATSSYRVGFGPLFAFSAFGFRVVCAPPLKL